MLSKLKVRVNGFIGRPTRYLVSVYFILIAWIEKLLCWLLLLLLMLLFSQPTNWQTCRYMNRLINRYYAPSMLLYRLTTKVTSELIELGAAKALNRRSAMFWIVGTYGNWMKSRSTRCRTKWCVMSMCLLGLYLIGFWANLITPWLSSWRRPGPSRCLPKLITKE